MDYFNTLNAEYINHNPLTPNRFKINTVTYLEECAVMF
jgi:hypothetical protein